MDFLEDLAGACIVEKHFSPSRVDGGPDGVFSIELPEFRQMVDDTQATEADLAEPATI